MIKHPLFILILTAIHAIGMISCDIAEERISRDASLTLSASTDSIKFDTLLSSVRSITQRININNGNKEAVQISDLSLGLGESSPYDLYINGVKGKSFQNEVLFGQDSLLLLIEVNIESRDQDEPFEVNDLINISYNGNLLQIPLVTWGQDAIFLEDETVDCDVIWTAGKPYVLKDTISVDTGCTLTIEKGTRVLIDNNSALKVDGTLIIGGTEEEKVMVRNTRSDGSFRIRPGQWNAIFFTENSIANIIDHAHIINGSIGLQIDHPSEGEDFELTVTNTSIGHMSIAGIRAFSSDVKLTNVEVFNCQSELLGGFAGGTYAIEHCTFSNEPNLFSRSQESVVFNEEQAVEGETRSGDLNISLTNSIIWGRQREELLVETNGGSNGIDISHNLIRSEDMDWETDDNTISQEKSFPGFVNSGLYDFSIKEDSNIRGQAVNSSVTSDIIGTVRDEMPDLGAYEWFDPEEKEGEDQN